MRESIYKTLGTKMITRPMCPPSLVKTIKGNSNVFNKNPPKLISEDYFSKRICNILAEAKNP